MCSSGPKQITASTSEERFPLWPTQQSGMAFPEMLLHNATHRLRRRCCWIARQKRSNAARRGQDCAAFHRSHKDSMIGGWNKMVVWWAKASDVQGVHFEGYVGSRKRSLSIRDVQEMSRGIWEETVQDLPVASWCSHLQWTFGGYLIMRCSWRCSLQGEPEDDSWKTCSRLVKPSYIVEICWDLIQNARVWRLQLAGSCRWWIKLNYIMHKLS